MEDKNEIILLLSFKFREINNSFEKLKATEKIPLPDEPEVTVSYKHLLTLEDMGMYSFIPEGSRKKYSVSDILGEIKIKRREEELLEETLRILNEKNEEEKLEKIVSLLRNLAKDQAEESDNLETLSKKLNKAITLQPNIMGVGFNFNQAIDLALNQYFRYKKTKK